MFSGRKGTCKVELRVCTQINPLLQLGFQRRAVEIISIQMYVASQRGSRCWRKTLARYGEAGPKRALCVEAGTKGQIISRTDSESGEAELCWKDHGEPGVVEEAEQRPGQS